jgi:hypothetical protein
MTRGRIAAPARTQAARKVKWSDETKRRSREMYADLEKRAAAAKKAIETEGTVLIDFKEKHYRNPFCQELDKAVALMMALLKAGIFETDPTDAKCIDPDDEDVSDLLD